VLRATGDEISALIAFALTAFCPTLLAHGRLATVDMAATLFIFWSAATLVAALKAAALPPHSNIKAGVLLGCALASKVSAIVLLPYAVMLMIARRVSSRAHPLKTMAAAALLTFIAIYLILARSVDLTLPFRTYWNEIKAVGQLYGDRYVLPQFLLGQFSHRGWPYYNLVAFAVKTPLPVLILICMARRVRFEVLACFAFVVLFFAVSAFSSLNLGIRHILPIFPFLYAGLAMAVPRNRIVYALVAWHVVTALVAYPSYIAYFNPLIGSHRNADRVLIDSNLDWGQDLHRLAAWSRAQHIGTIRVHYFGAGSVEYEFGPHAERWPAPGRELLPPGWFAVSRHFYRLSFDRELSPVSYDAYLRACGARFVTSIGGSIDVYRIDYDRAH
jgi:4-amino-4-deoxy-L-arabinose transferase-like glycosyltransferase